MAMLTMIIKFETTEEFDKLVQEHLRTQDGAHPVYDLKEQIGTVLEGARFIERSHEIENPLVTMSDKVVAEDS